MILRKRKHILLFYAQIWLEKITMILSFLGSQIEKYKTCPLAQSNKNKKLTAQAYAIPHWISWIRLPLSLIEDVGKYLGSYPWGLWQVFIILQQSPELPDCWSVITQHNVS